MQKNHFLLLQKFKNTESAQLWIFKNENLLHLTLFPPHLLKSNYFSLISEKKTRQIS